MDPNPKEPPLKPCPFCGGEAEVGAAEDAHIKGYQVSCQNTDCYARVVPYQHLVIAALRRLAVEMWNRRD